MADWAGAVAAMRARFAGAFNAAPVRYQNEDPPENPWPPSPAKPWVYFEVIQAQTALRGVGLPGNQTWLTVGHILIHAYVPTGSGLASRLPAGPATCSARRRSTTPSLARRLFVTARPCRGAIHQAMTATGSA